jgi:hypothetical protein
MVISIKTFFYLSTVGYVQDRSQKYFLSAWRVEMVTDKKFMETLPGKSRIKSLTWVCKHWREASRRKFASFGEDEFWIFFEEFCGNKRLIWNYLYHENYKNWSNNSNKRISVKSFSCAYLMQKSHIILNLRLKFCGEISII